METKSEWRQLGGVVSGVLEQLAERRRAQAEFLKCETATTRTPRASRFTGKPQQLELPLYA